MNHKELLKLFKPYTKNDNDDFVYCFTLDECPNIRATFADEDINQKFLQFLIEELKFPLDLSLRTAKNLDKIVEFLEKEVESENEQ